MNFNKKNNWLWLERRLIFRIDLEDPRQYEINQLDIHPSSKKRLLEIISFADNEDILNPTKYTRHRIDEIICEKIEFQEVWNEKNWEMLIRKKNEIIRYFKSLDNELTSLISCSSEREDEKEVALTNLRIKLKAKRNNEIYQLIKRETVKNWNSLSNELFHLLIWNNDERKELEIINEFFLRFDPRYNKSKKALWAAAWVWIWLLAASNYNPSPHESTRVTIEERSELLSIYNDNKHEVEKKDAKDREEIIAKIRHDITKNLPLIKAPQIPPKRKVWVIKTSSAEDSLEKLEAIEHMIYWSNVNEDFATMQRYISELQPTKKDIWHISRINGFFLWKFNYQMFLSSLWVCESNADPYAMSKSMATWLIQIQPRTARQSWYWKDSTKTDGQIIKELKNPTHNLRVWIAELSNIVSWMDKSWISSQNPFRDVLASYNVWPNAVKRVYYIYEAMIKWEDSVRYIYYNKGVKKYKKVDGLQDFREKLEKRLPWYTKEMNDDLFYEIMHSKLKVWKSKINQAMWHYMRTMSLYYQSTMWTINWQKDAWLDNFIIFSHNKESILSRQAKITKAKKHKRKKKG